MKLFKKISISISLICFVCLCEVSAENLKSADEPNIAPKFGRNGKMSGWQIHEYGGINSLHLNNSIDVPTISSDTEVLVEIHTTSVNPIDRLMTEGYGQKLLNTLRWVNGINEFPQILGREFTGVVKQKGASAGNVEVGDVVWGVLSPHLVGAHAEYVTVDQSTITRKPENIDEISAAAILYAGLTAWSSLFSTGGVQEGDTSNRSKKICILGASGGVGTLAVQIAKAEGMNVTATCSTNSVQMVKELGADRVVDYKTDDVNEIFRDNYFDIIFDCAAKGPNYATEVPWSYGQYITLEPPLLNNTDSSGLIIGSIKSAFSLFSSNVRTIFSNRGTLKWGIFSASSQGIQYLKKLVENGKLKPIIDSVFPFESTKEAFQKVKDGHLRGKVIIKVK